MLRVPSFEPMLAELEGFYDTLNPQGEKLGKSLDAMLEAHRGESVFSLKVRQMQILAEESDVHVFRYFPFWFQFSAGRGRFIWGGLGCCHGGEFLHHTLGKPFYQAYLEELEPDRQAGFIQSGANPVGLDHHALDYDAILQYGLNGLRDRAVRYREDCTPDARPFYDAAIAALDILKDLSCRFADAAREMLEREEEPAVLENLSWIADAARRIPAEPPKTFREALSAVLFCRECVGTLEGIGISTYGQLDRMLYSYYKADLEVGRITETEAKDLLKAMLYYTAVRFDEDHGYYETSTTIILGGCDPDGNPIYNDVTRLILEAEREIRVICVKFDARVSSAHPEVYLRQLCQVQLARLPVLVYMNDDTHIAARVKYGQDIRDARGYVAGGCHEIVLGGTEVCTRADTWISLPGLLLHTLKKREYGTFEELYMEAVADVKAFHERVSACKNVAESHWSEFNPLPLYSTMVADCLEKGLDVTAGGARYSSTALSMVGAATFIDSLYAVKVLCYDEGKRTLPELTTLLETDLRGRKLCGSISSTGFLTMAAEMRR